MAKAFNSNKAKQASSKSAKDQIPVPFVQAPSSLEPLLQRLDPSKVHITHIDRHKADYKKKIFCIPVVLNLIIAALLLWRAYHATPKYWVLLQTLLGYMTSATVDPERTTRRQQIWILLKRTGMMLFDFLLFRFIGPWPLTFFAEQPANPITWRWNIGFQREEIVVRISRHWGTEDLMQGVKQGQENPFFKTRILPSIEPTYMQKTAYLMMTESWDLEFELMQDAHVLVKRGELKLEDLDRVVLAYQDGIGWLVWKWEGAGDVIEGRRKKVVAFKEKLTKMGKESLFWKWTEIVEDERDRDGGFTPERQQKVAERVQKEFEKNGVDFEEVVNSIGGLDEVPLS